MRYINHRKLSVGLPLGFRIEDYMKSPDMDTRPHWEVYNDPTLLNEMHLTLHYNHLLKIYYNNNQDLFYFTYLIDDIIIHQYTDFIFYKDDAIIKLGRMVDNKLAFYCWRIRKRIFYQMVK